jgi:UDP-N-acetylmuramoyl-tripeptide--D-alanyl-D-alanine ligase
MSQLDVYMIWALGTLGCALSLWKWLRVAQREHYEPGRVSTIALIWNRARPINWLLVALVLATLAGSAVSALPGFVPIVLATVWPWGMPIVTKRTPLVVTGRVKRLLLASFALLIVIVAAALLCPPALAAAVLSVPAITDLALLITKPIEAALARKYVVAAQRRINDVAPLVVAITGSYGKTSTKSYASQLISRSKRTLASPASFNNLLGLSKAVNDGLLPGIDVFIAEMGTYGPGEIRRLCQLFKPSISAITTIGEAHLERMHTRGTIVRAKAEILDDAQIAVLNVDVPELAELADSHASEKTVLRCSATVSEGRDVAVIPDGERWHVYINGVLAAEIPAPPTGHGINLAIAIAIALAVGIDTERIVVALGNLSQPAHRAEVAKAHNGTIVIDDTYNSNPEGAAAAVHSALGLASDGATVWTITPGMIELGAHQRMRNRALAHEATAAPNMRLVITGYVNRRHLLAGATDRARVITAKDRAAAQRLVESDVAPGDVLLYENDLPSHYP